MDPKNIGGTPAFESISGGILDRWETRISGGGRGHHHHYNVIGYLWKIKDDLRFGDWRFTTTKPKAGKGVTIKEVYERLKSN